LIIVGAPDGTILQMVDDIDRGVFTNSLIENLMLPVNGLYKIEVRGWNNESGGAYALIIESRSSSTSTFTPTQTLTTPPSYMPSPTIVSAP